MKKKKYRDIETGKIYLEITPFIFYDFQKNEIDIIRETTSEEERDVSPNNDYPYGQSEILDLELLKNGKTENETTTIVIQEKIKLETIRKYLNSLKTPQDKE